MTTRYQIGGAVDVSLCDACVRHNHRTTMLTILVCFLIAGSGASAIFATAHTGTISFGEAMLILIGIVLSIAALLLLVALIMGPFESREDRGRDLAVDVRKPTLKEAGWDKTWSPKEYFELDLKSRLGPDDWKHITPHTP